MTLLFQALNKRVDDWRAGNYACDAYPAIREILEFAVEDLETGLFRAQVTDWRAVLDYVLIDADHDGEVFGVTLADVPERKQGLVNGLYELPLPRAGARVAVKIIDMLGEEIVVTSTP